MAQKLTLEALRIVDAIERRGSFASAAEELNKATSALSYTVQKLEEQLGVTLFQRQGRQSVLTPAGRLLLEEGRKILTASNLLTDRVKELADGWEPKIRIALESTYDSKHFFSTLAAFLKEHPNIELDIRESVLSGGWEALEYDEVDLLVGAPAPVPRHKGIRSVKIETPAMLLVASPVHPTAKALTKNRKTNDKSQLEKAIQSARRVVTHDTAKVNVERSAGLLDSSAVIYVQSLQQKIDAQVCGLGIGHLPRSAIGPELESGKLVILREQEIMNDCFLAWKIANKGKGLKALCKLLMENAK